jgi:hypothetical protein
MVRTSGSYYNSVESRRYETLMEHDFKSGGQFSNIDLCLKTFPSGKRLLGEWRLVAQQQTSQCLPG